MFGCVIVFHFGLHTMLVSKILGQIARVQLRTLHGVVA